MALNNSRFRILGIAFLGIVATAAYTQTTPIVTKVRGGSPVAADDASMVPSPEVGPGDYQGGSHAEEPTQEKQTEPDAHLSVGDSAKVWNTLQSGSENEVLEAKFLEVEVFVDDGSQAEALRSLPQAPGAPFEERSDPRRVVLQLAPETVLQLVRDGVNLRIVREFGLVQQWNAHQSDQVAETALLACTGTNREGSNSSNVNIPDNNTWVYSGITISGAPAGATVTCIDVHYEIMHSWIGDLDVDLNDQNLTYNYDLWIPDPYNSGENLNETVTGITTFNGELVNQQWLLFARDAAYLDTGYIDTWWIKVYYGGAVLQPDLIVQSSSRTPSTVAPGGSVSLTDVVKNQGTASAGSFYVTWFISTDSTVTTSDYEWGYRSVSSLAVGATSNGAGSLPWPATGTYAAPGTYYIAVMADDTNAVSESNEGNNWGVAWPVTVPPPPPDIRVAPNPLPPFTCTSTMADATAEEDEAGLGAPPQSSIDGAEKLVDPDGVIATRLAAGDERAPVIVSSVPTETGALAGLGEVSEAQIPDEAHAGIMSAPKTAHSQAEFTRLKAAARATGSVPVIVELAVPNIVVLTSRSSAAGTQAGLVQADGALSATIAAVAQAELARLAAVPHTPGRIFPYIPFMSLSASERALEILEASPIVLDINEDRLAEPTLDNTVNIVEASAAWARGFDGTGLYVAILDTGIRAHHNFFAGKTIAEACFARGQDGAIGAGDCPNGQSSDTSPPPAHPAQPYPSSFCGYEHGTHVAGIAAGEDPNRVPPLYGVARGANIIAIKVFSKFTISPPCDATCPSCLQSWDSDVMAGLNHVYSLRFTYNIAAVNMSLGGGGPFNDQTSCDNNYAGTKSIIDSLRTAGIATVIASGNDGFCNGISAPACISSAIAVGALNDSDDEPLFNNYGAPLDLFAPGVDVLSSVTSSDSAYANGTGISMATPHVTGAWAILKQAEPLITVTDALNALQSTGAVIDNACSGSGTYPQHRIRINAAICSGESITIFNDGGGPLNVSSIDKPTWAELSPLPPYQIAGGQSTRVCVTVDCTACVASLVDRLTIYSNDPDESTVQVSLRGPFASFAACLAGPDKVVPLECDCADFDNDGDVDLRDFSVLQR